MLAKLARALECSLAYLVDETVEDPKGRPTLSPDRERVLALAESIGLEHADGILTLVRMMGGPRAFLGLVLERAVPEGGESTYRRATSSRTAR